MDQQAIGNLIAEERKRRGLTQQQLADRLGVTNKAVSKWEKGRSLPDVALFEPLCGELELSVSELLAGRRLDEPERQSAAEKLLVESISTRKLVGLSAYLSINSVVGALLFIGPLLFAHVDGPLRALLTGFGLLECVLTVYFDCTLPGKEERRASLLVRIVYALCLFTALAALNYLAFVREGLPMTIFYLIFGGGCVLSVLLSLLIRKLTK